MANVNTREFLEITKKGWNEIREINKNSAVLLQKLLEGYDEIRAINKETSEINERNTETLQKELDGWQEIRDINKELRDESKDFIKEMRDINKETAKYVKQISKSIGGYTHNEGEAIEDEVNRNISKYLVRKFANFNVFKLNWKTLRKNTIAAMKTNDPTITEFDGLYLISNDSTFYVDNPVTKELQTNLTGSTNQFVVVEVKHDLDNSKINEKIKHMTEFKTYIEDAKVFDRNIHTQEFKHKIDAYSLNDIDSDIHLVFASPHIPQSCADYVRQMASVWKKTAGITVAIMVPSGNRYGIAWADTQFTPENILEADGVRVGAGKKKRATKKK